jgi:hypothetical protein
MVSYGCGEGIPMLPTADRPGVAILVLGLVLGGVAHTANATQTGEAARRLSAS